MTNDNKLIDDKETKTAIGLDEALGHTLARISPLGTKNVGLFDASDRIAGESLHAKVYSPSIDASLKDGYAVRSGDVAGATAEHPVRLALSGHMAAGDLRDRKVAPGTTIRILTGARIPKNADAVLAEEFVETEGDIVWAQNTAGPGRNILPKGSDVTPGKMIVSQGHKLTPGLVGLLAAAGHDRVQVFRNPHVAILGTGDEVVAPGRPLPEGKLYASNMATLGAWCARYGMKSRMALVKDDLDEMFQTLKRL
ncbi:MAG: molybdopterin molybdotransferase MoeA, partial [Deltaproteobacteria bacterium]|nr:molybdopterin molybdotransferase MoeA [Deltaproteobacteria bacterium]